MYTFKVKNAYGEMELTHNPAYSVQEIDGLDPAQAVINATRNAGQDGSTFNSAYVQERQITITLAINSPAEANRIALYRYFKPKFPITLFYANGARDVCIDGYVQTVMVSYFAKKEIAQITVVCPRPYFRDTVETLKDISNVVPLFEFPFSIPAAGIEFSRLDLNAECVVINTGDVETGMTIKIHVVGESVASPMVYNTVTNEYIKLEHTFIQGDTVTIRTGRGEKEITLLRDGVETNAIGYMSPGSSWLQLEPGDTLISATADENPEYMQVYVTFESLFEGV